MTTINFLHVGKTGGTAIIEALSEYKPSLDVRCHPHNVRLQDIATGEKFFFVLRDPVDRFVSGFYSRQRRGRPRYNVSWTPGEEEAFAAFETANGLAEALSSYAKEHRDAAHRAMRAIGHVSTSFYDWFVSDDYFLQRLDDVLFIGMLEHLDAEFETLKTLLAMPPAARLPKDDLRAHRNPEQVDRSLSLVGVRNLRGWYDKDYAFYALCTRIRRDGGAFGSLASRSQ